MPESQTARPSPSTPESKTAHTGIEDRVAMSTSTLLVDPEGKLRIVPTASAGKELKQRFGLQPVYVNHLLNPSHNRNTLKE